MRVHQSLLDDCMRRMQYKLEEPAFYGGSVRALGTAYHRALEEYYVERQTAGFFDPTDPPRGYPWVTELVSLAQHTFDEMAEGGTSHASESGKEFGGFIWGKAVPDAETAYGMLDVMVRSYFENGHFWPDGWEVIAVEQFFELPWHGDLTRGGSIDLILQDPHGWLVIDDQKTAGRAWNKGKESPRKNIQAPWYSWAAQDLFPGYHGYRSVFSIMKYNGDFERRISDPTPLHVEAAANLLATTVGLYRTARANGFDMPANPSSNWCSPEYCDYWSKCPHGAAVDV